MNRCFFSGLWFKNITSFYIPPHIYHLWNNRDTLYKQITFPGKLVHGIHPVRQLFTSNTILFLLYQTEVGRICFSVKRTQQPCCTVHCTYIIVNAILYWNNTFTNRIYKKIWSLPNKYTITNKVKQVSLKLQNLLQYIHSKV